MYQQETGQTTTNCTCCQPLEQKVLNVPVLCQSTGFLSSLDITVPTSCQCLPCERESILDMINPHSQPTTGDITKVPVPGIKKTSENIKSSKISTKGDTSKEGKSEEVVDNNGMLEEIFGADNFEGLPAIIKGNPVKHTKTVSNGKGVKSQKLVLPEVTAQPDNINGELVNEIFGSNSVDSAKASTVEKFEVTEANVLETSTEEESEPEVSLSDIFGEDNPARMSNSEVSFDDIFGHSLDDWSYGQAAAQAGRDENRANIKPEDVFGDIVADN